MGRSIRLLFDNNVLENKIPYFRSALSNRCVVCGFSCDDPAEPAIRDVDISTLSQVEANPAPVISTASASPKPAAPFYVAPHSAMASLMESSSDDDDNDHFSFALDESRLPAEESLSCSQDIFRSDVQDQTSHPKFDARTGLVSFHVVPPEFRRHFPLPIKSHNSYDVLLLCVSCHRLASFHLTRFSKELYAELPPTVLLPINIKNRLLNFC